MQRTEGMALPDPTPPPTARTRTMKRRTKGLRLQLPALHDSQDESWLRPLTVKLRGRPEAPS
jgi:hypothetical protein